MFDEKYLKKSVNIIQKRVFFSLSQQMRIIVYFKLVTFSINQKLTSSKILKFATKTQTIKIENFSKIILCYFFEFNVRRNKFEISSLFL